MHLPFLKAYAQENKNLKAEKKMNIYPANTENIRKAGAYCPARREKNAKDSG